MGYVFSRSFLDSPPFFFWNLSSKVLRQEASKQGSQPASIVQPETNTLNLPPKKKRKSFAMLKPILNKL